MNIYEWENLNDDQLKKMARWTDWAEHHAELQHSKAGFIKNRQGWAKEILELAKVQSEIRAIIARRTSKPQTNVKVGFPSKP